MDFILNFIFFFFKTQFVWSSLQYAKYPVIYIAISMKIHLENLEVVSVL